MEKWIRTKDKLPESGQEVLTCYYDETSERNEIGILTYFKMGDVMYWNGNDANDYIESIKLTLKEYLPKQIETDEHN